MKYILIVAAIVMALSGSALAQDTGFGDWDAPFEDYSTEYDYSSNAADNGYTCGGSGWGGYSVNTGWDDWYTL